MEQIHDNPLKFILFFDDLSLSAEEDSLGILRAMLEGSVAARPENTVIYAASNQIPERIDDASSPEQQALAARFGIRVCFRRPDREAYLAFTHALAVQYGLHMDPAALEQAAEDFAAQSGGRSPRAAKQLIEQLSSREE